MIFWLRRYLRTLWRRWVVRREISRLSATERAARGETTHNATLTRNYPKCSHVVRKK